MTIEKMLRLVIAVALLTVCGTAHAVSIRMSPTEVAENFDVGGIARRERDIVSDDPTVGGGFDILFDPTITFAQQKVDYYGARIPPVPLPAAVVLMIGGLGILAGFRRKLTS